MTTSLDDIINEVYDNMFEDWEERFKESLHVELDIENRMIHTTFELPLVGLIDG